MTPGMLRTDRRAPQRPVPIGPIVTGDGLLPITGPAEGDQRLALEIPCRRKTIAPMTIRWRDSAMSRCLKRARLLGALAATTVTAVVAAPASADINGWNLNTCAAFLNEERKQFGVNGDDPAVISRHDCVRVIETWVEEWRNANLFFRPETRAWFDDNWPSIPANARFRSSTATAIRAYKATYRVRPTRNADFVARIGRGGNVNASMLGSVMNADCVTSPGYRSAACHVDVRR